MTPEDSMANAILAAVNKMSRRLNSLLLWSKQAERRMQKLEQIRVEESSSSEEGEEEEEVEDEVMEVGTQGSEAPFQPAP